MHTLINDEEWNALPRHRKPLEPKNVKSQSRFKSKVVIYIDGAGERSDGNGSGRARIRREENVAGHLKAWLGSRRGGNQVAAALNGSGGRAMGCQLAPSKATAWCRSKAVPDGVLETS